MTKYFPSPRLRFAAAFAADALCYCAMFVLLMLAWRWFRLPQGPALFDSVAAAFRSYGFLFVVVSALIEGLLVINLYFPGSLVILIGVTAFREQPAMVVLLVAMVAVAFFLATVINYCIGYFGLHALIRRLKVAAQIEKVSQWYQRFGRWFVPISFFHPNLSAFVSVACGRDRVSPYQFFSVAFVSITLWNAFWGFLTYRFGALFKEAAANPWLILAGLCLWAAAKLIRGLLLYRKQS